MDKQTQNTLDIQSGAPAVTPNEPKKSYGRNWKKLILIYMIIGALIYAAIYYFILAKNKPAPYSSSTPTVEVSKAVNISPSITTDGSSSEQEKAKAQAEGFYSRWLDPKRFDLGYKENFETTIDNLLKEGYITQKAAAQLRDGQVQYDVVTCSQNLTPYSQYKFLTPTIQGTTATMTVSGTYNGPPPAEKVIKLNLVKSAFTWSIDMFTCPPSPVQ